MAALENRSDQEELLRSLGQPPLVTRPRSVEPLTTFAEAFPRPNGATLAQLVRAR